MLEKGRISAAQFSILAGMSVLATSLLTAPGIVAIDAKQDMWISPIWISSAGFILVWTLYKLNQAYPDQTLVEYAVSILGRFAGKTVAALYLVFVIFATANVLRQFTDFIKLTFLLTTPDFVISGCMLLVCWLVARSGIETVARLPMLLLPLVTLFVLMIYTPSIADIRFERLTPVMEKGAVPSLIGAFRLLSWMPAFSIMNFYMPYLNNRKHLLYWSLGSVVVVTLTLSVTFVIVYTVIGAAVVNYTYPFMILARYISFTEFFEHLESIVMMIWVIQIVIRISFGLYGAALGMAQCFGLTGYKPMVPPICMLILLFSLWGIENAQFVSSPSMVVYYTLFGMMLPFLLLVVYGIRQLFAESDSPGYPEGETSA
ncbi:GerAB/ArcD/ProY family transporter [Paenibacillus kobensis]|uniref:GerAB/ArcD/ProY family transporter n=1 Tax=Paenibacillus kobensis TaxID=59841 RepID=UPI000FDBE553|nr:endospore germination permease [Paenibacillus kobensis]